MWHRISYEQWTAWISIGTLAFFLVAFLIFVVRVLRMKKDKETYLSNLPLEKEQTCSE